MIADLGFGLLVVTFLLALASAVLAACGYYLRDSGWVEGARRGMLLTFPLITLAAISLIYLLISGHFEVRYVYSVTSLEMPLYLKITALWGGQEGSLILWSWLMSAFASAVMLRHWERDREFLAWVVVVTAVTLGFFLSLTIFFENPFARWWQTAGGEVAAMFRPAGAIPLMPADGAGLNPLLRHPGMIIHPPMLYLGFVSFVIPFAFAIASLVTGRSDDRWIRVTRRWTLVAWLFLSCGLVLGMRWAYDVLGWGGFWGWDPVEVAALMPWLAGTAFLHSVMIQEKRGMFKHWSMVLIILTYLQVIYGTFLTRTGLLSSVHAFAESKIGIPFFIFLAVMGVASVILLILRWGKLRSNVEMNSLLSREALFLLNNFLFLLVDVVCFIGVNFPIFSQILANAVVTVGPPWYTRITGPLWAGLMLLMAVAPLSAWGHSTALTLGGAIWKPSIFALLAGIAVYLLGIHNPFALIGLTLVALVLAVTLYEFWRGARGRAHSRGENFFLALWHLAARNRRRYGGYLIHISMVLMAVGIIGMQFYQTQTQGTVPLGSSLALGNYSVKYDSVASFTNSDGRQVTRAVISVYENGRYVGDLHPRIDYYPSDQQTMTIPGLYSTLANDVYVLLVDWQPASAQNATFKIFNNPLINWLWLGALIFIFGILVAAWPDRDVNPLPVTVPAITPAESTE